MKHAIAQLELALEVAENNAPINEANQNFEQAEIERKLIDECKKAIRTLKWEDDSPF